MWVGKLRQNIDHLCIAVEFIAPGNGFAYVRESLAIWEYRRYFALLLCLITGSQNFDGLSINLKRHVYISRIGFS